MSLIDAGDGEVFVLLDETEARILTDRIKTAVEHAWSLLEEAHHRRAWAALGYRTFEQYIKAEFNMSRRHAYRLLDQGAVIRGITTAAGCDQMVTIEEATARDLKPHLPEVTEAVRARTNGVAPERVKEIVHEVVRQERERIVQRREANAAIAELNALAPPGFDAEADKAHMLLAAKVFDAVADLVALPPPDEIVPLIRPTSAYRLDELTAAVDWLNRFADLWEAR